MNSFRRLGYCTALFLLTFLISLSVIWHIESDSSTTLTDGNIMVRLFLIPTIVAVVAFSFPTRSLSAQESIAKQGNIDSTLPKKTYLAQVVGLQWLNPLQRKDYPTEWQLLWTMGLAQPNKNDDMAKAEPKLFNSVQPILAIGINNGGETFEGFYWKYIRATISPFRDIYFSNSRYFYNAHEIKDKTTRRELAGIRIEHALPEGKLKESEATEIINEMIVGSFDIGNPHFPNSWTRSTPPDIHLTMGGANAGFTSLSRGLAYLEANPSQTVWVMNWDAPSFPKDGQIDENMVLLVLAGPDYKTERAPLAWLSYPADVNAFESGSNLPSRSAQAWKAVVNKAALNAGKQPTDIGFLIHDANTVHQDSSDRLASLGRTVTEEIPELDFMKQTFNTPAVLGDMRAGTALTNVALAIAYANHIGKNVLVAGTTDQAHPTATVVVPPAVVRPINHDEPWFRARSGNYSYLAWWGIRQDAKDNRQGYSQ